MRAKKTLYRTEHNLEEALKPYIIRPALPMVLHMLQTHSVKVELSQRQGRNVGWYMPAKGEDYASGRLSRLAAMQKISLQINLNPYALLFVFLHEWAHLITQKQYGNTVSDHGKEWKNNFKDIFRPFLTTDIFPGDVLSAIDNYFVKTSRFFETELEQCCNKYGADRKEFARQYFELLQKGIEIPAPDMGIREHQIKAVRAAEKEKLREGHIQQQLAQWAENEKQKPQPQTTGTAAAGTLPEGAVFRINGEDYRITLKDNDYITARSESKGVIRIHRLIQVETVG